MSVIVVVPVYKSTLEQFEVVSLKQTLRVLSEPVCLVTPEALETQAYEEIAAQCDRELIIKSFDTDYFKNIDGYNRLMLSQEFYTAFVDYDYLLIAQLDCYIFSDQLKVWCDKGYDYIGAPFYGMKDVQQLGTNFYKTSIRRYLPFLGQKKNILVGNGGLSLRKVDTMISMLGKYKKIAEAWNINEDIFWSFRVPGLYPWFKKPSVAEAVKFAFEKEPEMCLRENNGVLPFGCHAWQKEYTNFWQKYIKME